MNNAPTEIAYILKGFGRTSETFITNEIHLLEKLGLQLTIFSLIKLQDQQRHAVVDAIKAPVHYLPLMSSLTDESFFVWLKHNISVYGKSHRQVFTKRPFAYLAALSSALLFALRYKEKQFIKEFLQAGYIAEQILSAGKFRQLHAHFAHTVTTVTMFASQLCGLPFSFTAHAKDIYLRELNPGNLLAIKLQRAKFIATCTQANEKYLREVNPHAAPIHTIYHGLDTTQFTPREKITTTTERPLILAVGRFVEKKGYAFLVEACQILKEQNYNFECRIVGGGDAEKTKAQISKLNLGNAVFIDAAVTQEKLREIYARATMFVLPCQITDNGDRDGIPNVLAEAMAMGLPVVSTNISGIPELVTNYEGGLLVPQKDAAALAKAMAELLNDEPLREKLSRNARAKVCQIFDAQVNVQALYKLFS